jgi:hypothetical protein
MRFFDTDVQKASKNIIKTLNLNESAASVKSQINRDKPEEAPKETKDALVKKVQNAKIKSKKPLKEDITDIQNQIAELQDYLDNTSDISDDERASIQAEINELLDEVNFYDAGLDMEVEEPSEDDLHLGESEELTEAPNPENADINKKILATIKAKSDVEPKYYDDLVKAGLEVSPDRYNPGYWRVTGPNGRSINRTDLMGGRQARFIPNSQKSVDYYNLLNKDFDEDKYYYTDTRYTKPTQDRHTRSVYNPETGKYDYKTVTDYNDEPYSIRQRNSQGYDYNDLKGGSKDVKDYKQATRNYNDYKAGSWHDKFSDREIDKAQQEYDDFQASISDRIAKLKAELELAKERKADKLKVADDAAAKRQEILDKVRAKRNQQ